MSGFDLNFPPPHVTDTAASNEQNVVTSAVHCDALQLGAAADMYAHRPII